MPRVQNASMVIMLDIKLTSQHDIDTSGLDLNLIGLAEQVRQQLLIKLRLWRGEWFLNTDFGTPYLQEILGKQLTLSGAIAALQKSILEVTDVRRIITFTYAFSNATRKLTVNFVADTPYGIIEVAS
jgi:hypothetical protein